MLHSRIDDERESAIFREMDKANDRSAAIVGGGLVEHALARAIMARLRELSDDEQRGLFETERSLLSTFDAKIQLGYVLNLFSSPTCADLRAVKKVRNLFAHRLEIQRFDHPEIVAVTNKLIHPKWQAAQLKKPEIEEHRVRYERTVAHLGARFNFIADCIVERPGPEKASYSYDAWARPTSQELG